MGVCSGWGAEQGCEVSMGGWGMDAAKNQGHGTRLEWVNEDRAGMDVWMKGGNELCRWGQWSGCGAAG